MWMKLHHLHFRLLTAFIAAGITNAQNDGCFFAADKCPHDQIDFWLFRNNSKPLLLDYNNLTQQFALVPPVLPLKVLLHGFNGSRDISPNTEVRPGLLRTQHVYVLSVDYGRLVRYPCYPWAVYNIRIVGRCLAQFLDRLIEVKIYKSEDFHVIGFSLGAHVAGFASTYAKNRLKHITGLDPAGPGFAGVNLTHRLDPSDAEFVDVIHTDPFLFSMLDALGHVDFYVNLDVFLQPGCGYFSEGRFQNCHHFRATSYYGESVVSKRGFWSYHCGNWKNFIRRNCSPYAHIPNVQMGYFVPKNARGSYFVSTFGTAPFAKGPIVDFELDAKKKARNKKERQSSNDI